MGSTYSNLLFSTVFLAAGEGESLQVSHAATRLLIEDPARSKAWASPGRTLPDQLRG